MSTIVPDCLDKSVEELTKPVAQSIGKTINDLWFLALGGISQIAEKKRIKYAQALEEFKNSLEEKANAIPNENRTEPDTQIACQALQDAKYCVENEQIREMFANLIASTMDNRVSKTVHPSFSSILKQMSAADAKFLTKFVKVDLLPVCRIQEVNKENREYSILFSDLYIEETDTFEQTIYDNAFIISTLNRLGLIDVIYTSFVARQNVYDVFFNSLFFKSCVEHEKTNADIRIELKTGCMELTNLGRIFLEVCLPVQSSSTADAAQS